MFNFTELFYSNATLFSTAIGFAAFIFLNFLMLVNTNGELSFPLKTYPIFLLASYVFCVLVRLAIVKITGHWLDTTGTVLVSVGVLLSILFVLATIGRHMEISRGGRWMVA